jgi:hypothetical protein
MTADVKQFPGVPPVDPPVVEQIKIKCGFFESFNPEHGLSKLTKSNRLPVKTAYWLARLLVKINREAELYAKERQKLVDEYCDKDEKGIPVAAGPGQVKMVERRTEFVAKMTELADVDIEIGINKLTLNLNDIPTGVVSAQDLVGIESFIDVVE